MNIIDQFEEKYKHGFTVNDYLQEVKRTYEPEFWKWGLDETKVNILDKIHCIMGVIDEMAEFHFTVLECVCDTEKIKELSDIFWYLANYCNFTGIEFVPTQNGYEPYNFQFESVLGIHKKELAYNKKTDFDQLEEFIQTGIEYLYGICRNLDIAPEEVMKINLKKLYLRYPTKFESDLAINKDESKEIL